MNKKNPSTCGSALIYLIEKLTTFSFKSILNDEFTINYTHEIWDEQKPSHIDYIEVSFHTLTVPMSTIRLWIDLYWGEISIVTFFLYIDYFYSWIIFFHYWFSLSVGSDFWVEVCWTLLQAMIKSFERIPAKIKCVEFNK